MNTEDFGKYRIERRIAAGGMAELFVGFLQGAKGFERKVAIKRILPHLAADSAFQSMFWDEATLAANLNHPNVVQVLDFGEEAGQLFMALEYVDGVDLKTLSKQLRERGRGLGAEELALIAEGIAAGLHHVHTACSQTGEPLNIIHRDISPHNVMVSRDGHIKVMDFGVAHAEIRSSKTATGVLKGKLAYMAPEQANDETLDHRVDQFALGLLLWELAVGEAAYQGPNDAVLLRKVLTRDLDELATYRDDLPESFRQMVMRMLEANPDDRYPNMDAVHRMALQIRFGLGEAGATASLSGLSEPAAVSASQMASVTSVAEEGVEATSILSSPTTSNETVLEATRLADSQASSNPTAVTRALEAADHSEAPTTMYEPALSPKRSFVGRLTAAFIIAAAMSFAFWLGSERGAVEPNTVTLTPLPQRAETPLPKEQEPALEKEVSTPEASTIARTADAPELEPPKNSAKPASRSTKKQPLRSSSTKPKQKKSPSQSVGKGALQLRVEEGWYNVVLGSRRLGTTPLGGVSLPVGRHRLTLENPVTGEKRIVSVKIEPGEITKVLVGADK